MVEYKTIESPVSNFNNLITKLSTELDNIYNPNHKGKLIKLLSDNQLIFDSNSILIYNFIRIKKNCIGTYVFNFERDIDSSQLHLIEITLENIPILFDILNRYLFVVNCVTKNMDDSVSQKYIESIYNLVMSNQLTIDNNCFLVPYKRKIRHLCDSDKTIENLYSKFEYIITFNKQMNISYSLMRVLSSDLNESKSIENIRYLEKETIKTGIINKDRFPNFLKELFYYGELID